MIGAVGLNHNSASVAVRERFAFNEGEIERFIPELQKEHAFDEVVVLSTCNRTEVYFSSPKPCSRRDFGALIRCLCRFKEIGEDIPELFYTFQEKKAVTHLFRVAAGLNSMVLGENQILGQIKNAYRISASRKFTAAVLNRLFHRSFEVGKSVRAQTAINEGASSVGYAAVELAARIFDNLAERPVLLIGAGRTGELVLESLDRRGSRHLHIANRTHQRAVELARRFGAEAVAFDRFEEHFLHCDIIIASVASRQPLVRADFLEGLMKKRRNRSLFLIDLSVPRTVETGVRELEGVFVYDVDDLDMVISHNREKRKSEIEKADRIVERYTEEFFAWLSTLELAPTIARLKDRFESISGSELEKLKKRIAPETYEQVQRFSESVKGKYLGLIVKNLRALSREGRQLEYVDMVNDLFDLQTRNEQ
jgi:glutamyl-tRNA reductase